MHSTTGTREGEDDGRANVTTAQRSRRRTMNIIKSAKSGGKGSSIPPTIVVSIKAPPCPTPPPPHQWQSIVLPLIAGLLHARVFYRAALGCVPLALAVTGTTSTTTTATTSDEFRMSCYLLDSSIFLAYAFDLVSCLYFGVIPFSRCNCSRDIVGHHVPTLLLALPLAVPLWCDWERLRGIDMSSYSILDDPTVDGGTRDAFVSAYSMASGFAYVSSLNEVFMCLQRVEVSLFIFYSRARWGGEEYISSPIVLRNEHNSTRSPRRPTSLPR